MKSPPQHRRAPMVDVTRATRRKVIVRACAWAVETYPDDRAGQVLAAREMCEALGVLPPTPVATTE